MIQFNQKEVIELIRACKTQQDQTGSEYIWDQYEHLIHKLHVYEKEYEVDNP